MGGWTQSWRLCKARLGYVLHPATTGDKRRATRIGAKSWTIVLQHENRTLRSPTHTHTHAPPITRQLPPLCSKASMQALARDQSSFDRLSTCIWDWIRRIRDSRACTLHEVGTDLESRLARRIVRFVWEFFGAGSLLAVELFLDEASYMRFFFLKLFNRYTYANTFFIYDFMHFFSFSCLPLPSFSCADFFLFFACTPRGRPLILNHSTFFARRIHGPSDLLALVR